jgi:hypothetical protein
MANNIDFKYLNDNTGDPIEGLNVNYSVKVIAVLADIKDPTSINPRGSVLTSSVIKEGTETTDEDGIITVDVTEVFSDNEFLAIFAKFNNSKNYNVSIEIKLETEKQEIGPYLYVSRTDIPVELSAYNVIFSKKEDGYEYPDIEYWSDYNDFYVQEIVIDEGKLREFQSNKLRSQREYINTLEDFQNEITSQSILQIPVLNEFNPININQIITRCLELLVGTVDNGLIYTTDAGLIAETNRLNKIKTLINQISNLYPTITIEDGEGIPYQNIGVIPEPFRGLGFYQDGGDIIAFALTLLGDDMGRWGITLNGEGIRGTYGGYTSKFDYNLTSIFAQEGITLNVGDVIEISVEYKETLYFSKLIIKN